MILSKYLVLSKRLYDFKNDNNERVAGAKISYISKRPSEKTGEEGHPPMIVSINENMAAKLEEVPAIYDMEFEQVTGKNNRPEILLVDIDFVSSVDASALF